MLTEYPVIAAPATEQEAVAVWQAEDASLQLLRQQQEMAEMQLSVARQGWIPKFELGYKQAYEVGDMFYGFAVGISLPLFKTGSEVKAERARALSQAWQAEDAAVQKASEASQLYREVTALQSALQDYELLKQQDNRTLLMKALQGGQISLLEYMTDMAQLNSIDEDRLLIEYQYYNKLSELDRYNL